MRDRITEKAACCGLAYKQWVFEGQELPREKVCCRCGKPLEWHRGKLPPGSYARPTVDRDVPNNGPEKSARIDLGLELLQYLARPGLRYSYEEIAAFCGCSQAAIYLEEKKALRKLRRTIARRGLTEELAAAVAALGMRTEAALPEEARL